ncbi:MAG TPA: C4-dicarboxylate transporter DcuC [Gemmataceae bacterium]|nr:C4-dicarboxylate transporter DcuC [Gemmataceae bacterium]
MKLGLGLLIIAAAVYAILRRMDVRLVLLLAAVLLGAIGTSLAEVKDGLTSVVRVFLTTLSNEQFVVPICTAMGFAHVLRLTSCDQHLVHLLVQPLQRVRGFLIPGAVLVGFIVNIPVISQTSTAVAIGPVLVPLLLAARISPLTTGAALLLGASLGGELINPGAPELQTVSNALSVSAGQCVSKLLPLLFIQLAVATIVFWLLSHRAEKKFAAESVNQDQEKKEAAPPFHVSWVKAAVPLVPLALLFVMSAPLYLVRVPPEWLVADYSPEKSPLFNGRLIGAAMLIGVVVATLTTPSAFPQSARAFFEGAGYAVTHIISLIVTAQCFGEGVRRIGLANVIGEFTKNSPSVLVPSAGILPLAFAWLSGSGMAATQSLFQFFTQPSADLGIDPIRVGGVVSISAAAGRTMSPVSAVALMCGTLTATGSLDLCKRVALPLLAGVAVVIVVALVLVQKG